MTKVIYPNSYCPCNSGKKFKKCCQNKVRIPIERMSLEYLAGLISEEGIVSEQVRFFDNEKKAVNDRTVNVVCEIKKCFVRGITSFDSIRKVLSINEASSALLDDYGLRLLIVEASSQFIAQLNGLSEEEFVEIHDVLDGISSLQLKFPKESYVPENNQDSNKK